MVKINYYQISLIVILLIIITSSSLVIALGDEGDIFGNKEYTEGSDDFLHGWLTMGYNHLPALEPIPGWNPVNQWEVQQCELRLYDEGESKLSSSGGFTSYSFNGAVQITAQGEQRTTPEENYFENSLGWYIQTFDEDTAYNIEITYEDGSKKSLSEINENFGELSAKVGGASSFIAWSGDKQLLTAKISLESGETFTIPFVKKDN